MARLIAGPKTATQTDPPWGEFVRYQFPNNGWLKDQELGRQHLTLGTVYTIERTRVGDSRTIVCLEEVPGFGFNSVLFANVRD